MTNDPDRKKLGPLVLEHGQGDIPSISHSDKNKSNSLRSKQVDGVWLFDWGSIDLFVITPQPDGTVVLSAYWKECQAAFSKNALPNRNPDKSFVYFRSDVKTTQVLKDAPNRKSTEDMKSLQGEWAAIEEEVGGKSFDNQTVRTIDRRMSFKGNLLTMSQMWSNEIGDRLSTHQGPFHIDATTGAFDFMAKTSDGTDVEFRGIYKLSGDRLTICYKYAKGDSTTRPTMFKTEAGSGTVFALAVFKRDKK